MSYTNLTRNELVKLKNSIQNSIEITKDRIAHLEENYKKINDALKQLETKKSSSILIPSGLIYLGDLNSDKPKYEWKKKVERCIKLSDSLLSCRQILSILSNEDDWIYITQREALKNISSALTYLCRDGKIKKVNIENHKSYFYGNVFLHFDINGNLKGKNKKIATTI